MSDLLSSARLRELADKAYLQSNAGWVLRAILLHLAEMEHAVAGPPFEHATTCAALGPRIGARCNCGAKTLLEASRVKGVLMGAAAAELAKKNDRLRAAIIEYRDACPADSDLTEQFQRAGWALMKALGEECRHHPPEGCPTCGEGMP